MACHHIVLLARRRYGSCINAVTARVRCERRQRPCASRPGDSVERITVLGFSPSYNMWDIFKRSAPQRARRADSPARRPTTGAPAWHGRRGAHTVAPVIALAGSLSMTSAAVADDAATASSATKASIEHVQTGLQSYEPNAFGYTKNNDDAAYENFRLSVKFPLAPMYLAAHLPNDHLYFAFTGAFAFYIGTRPSSPVVGQEYNPKLFWQHDIPCREDPFTDSRSYGDGRSREVMASNADAEHQGATKPVKRGTCYVTFGYNHSSDGQTIDTLSAFQEAVRSKGSVVAATDAISRGWDYLEVAGRVIVDATENHRFTLYPAAKFFLPHGLLQGRPEEIHDWEPITDGKQRKTVDGLSLLGKFQTHVGKDFDKCACGFGDAKVALRYLTGYQDPFKHGTVRLEVGIHILELPVTAWAQRGYMTDLAQYYRYVTGYGVQVEIGSF
jgi:hypothetical protein